MASEKSVARKAEKTRKKAVKKEYERNHAQLKRQQAFHAVLLAGQVKRNKSQAKRDAG
jgi:hypothetical protein